MGLGSSQFSASTVVAQVPEVWSTIINEELFAKSVAANFFTDLSSFATEGGDIIHVPDLYTNSFTVQTQSTQGTEVTLGNPAQVDTTLTVNTHKYIALQIGDKELAQLASKYNFNAEYARKIVGSLDTALEASLFALWSSVTTNVVGDTATVLSDAEIRQAINKLATGNFDLRECAFFFHPYVFWVQLGAVAKYYDASQAGSMGNGYVRTGTFGNADIGRSMVGQLYGIPVFTSTNVVSGLQTYRNLLAHKSALGYAVQTRGGNKVRVQMENRLEFLSTVMVADILYGVAALRETAAVVLNASTAFIGS